MMAIRKLLLVALKDFRLIFRDRSALVLMLLAPFLLTIGMGAVTGRFSGTSSNSGIEDIPVVLVNQDDGALGSALVDLFTSADLDALVNPQELNDPAAARKLVPVYPQKVSSKVTAEKTVIERRMCLRATATPRLTGKTGMAADL